MPQSPPALQAEPDLKQYVAVLLRRRWLIGGIVVACVLASIVFSLTQPKVYEAKAYLILDGGAGESVVNANQPIRSVEQTTGSESRVMSSSATAKKIEEKLGYLPKVKIEVPEKVASLTVIGRASTGSVAARMANDWTSAYAEIRTADIGEQLKTAIADVQSNMADLDQQLAKAELKANDVERAAAAETDPQKKLVLQYELRRLRNDLSTGTVATRLQAMRDSESRLQTAATLNRGGAFTVAKTRTPKTPVSPKPVLNALVALATGLLLGLGAAFARDFFDDTLRTKEDLDAASSNIPVLGLIPKVRGWRDREDVVLETLSHPRAPAAEAYRNLRTSLDFASIDHKITLVQVTSSSSGEGKTTTAANLAVAMANADKRVIIVDCDLRRPRLHKFFGLDNDQGFTSVLLGDCAVQDALQRPTDVANLLVLSSGPPPPNPSELLSTKPAEELLQALTQPADIVIIDSPPLLPVADAAIIAGYAHSTLLVVTARSTTRRSLRRSLELLSQVDAPLEGLVFNGVGQEATYAGGYGYEADAPEGSGRRGRRASHAG